MNNAKELRKITDAKNKYESKQFKYTLKLFSKLNRLARRGKSKYIITPYYMPKWFDYDFKCGLIHLLQEKGFEINIIQRRHELGTLYNVIKIKW